MLAQDLGWASLALSFWIVVALYNYTESMLNSLAWQTTALITIITFVVPYKGRRASRQGQERYAVVGDCGLYHSSSEQRCVGGRYSLHLRRHVYLQHS
jgi:hypothetical protein